VNVLPFDGSWHSILEQKNVFKSLNHHLKSTQYVVSDVLSGWHLILLKDCYEELYFNSWGL
jgi:hypothetical protein